MGLVMLATRMQIYHPPQRKTPLTFLHARMGLPAAGSKEASAISSMSRIEVRELDRTDVPKEDKIAVPREDGKRAVPMEDTKIAEPRVDAMRIAPREDAMRAEPGEDTKRGLSSLTEINVSLTGGARGYPTAPTFTP